MMLNHLRRFHHQHIRVLATAVVILFATTLSSYNAAANPQGGQVVAGSASINQSSSANTVINQTSQKAIVNWHSFSINQGEQTTFNQPNAQSITLNRVVGVDPSKIMGSLKANGQVWLINPNGILFGKTAQVDVGGLLATTLDISNADFMAGNYRFYNTNNSGSMVVNEGQITVNDAGLAALVAPGVENSGVIVASLGKIQLGSASGFTVDLGGDGTFNFLLDQQMAQQLVSPDGTVPSAAVTNSGSLIADGGTILLTADTAKSVIDHAIDMSGYARAQGVSTQGGTIVLNGGDNGSVNVSGTLDASGQGGGTISVLGGMQDGTVNVSGTLDASAPNGGNGGFIETSAAHVNVANTADITTAAPYGVAGTWLIDPHDYTIASSGGDITGSLLTSELANNNVTILSSEGSTGSSGNIYVNDAVSWSNNTLTLTAANNIYVNAIMALSDSASLALNPSTSNGRDTVVSPTSIAIVMGQTAGASSTDYSSYTGRIDFSGACTYTGKFTVDGVTVISNDEFPTTPATQLTAGVDTSLLSLTAVYASNIWEGTSLWAFGGSSFYRFDATVVPSVAPSAVQPVVVQVQSQTAHGFNAQQPAITNNASPITISKSPTTNGESTSANTKNVSSSQAGKNSIGGSNGAQVANAVAYHVSMTPNEDSAGMEVYGNVTVNGEKYPVLSQTTSDTMSSLTTDPKMVKSIKQGACLATTMTMLADAQNNAHYKISDYISDSQGDVSGINGKINANNGAPDIQLNKQGPGLLVQPNGQLNGRVFKPLSILGTKNNSFAKPILIGGNISWTGKHAGTESHFMLGVAYNASTHHITAIDPLTASVVKIDVRTGRVVNKNDINPNLTSLNNSDVKFKTELTGGGGYNGFTAMGYMGIAVIK